MKYGCHNRAEFKPHIGQAGWYMDGHTRTPRMVSIPQTMAKACQYTKFQLTPTSPANRDDPQCTGCRHKQESTK